jgi:hypothetical protein
MSASSGSGGWHGSRSGLPAQVYARQLALPFDPNDPCAEAFPTKASTIKSDHAW